MLILKSVNQAIHIYWRSPSFGPTNAYLINIEISNDFVKNSIEVVEEGDDLNGRGSSRNGGEPADVAEIYGDGFEILRGHDTTIDQLIRDSGRQELRGNCQVYKEVELSLGHSMSQSDY